MEIRREPALNKSGAEKMIMQEDILGRQGNPVLFRASMRNLLFIGRTKHWGDPACDFHKKLLAIIGRLKRNANHVFFQMVVFDGFPGDTKSHSRLWRAGDGHASVFFDKGNSVFYEKVSRVFLLHPFQVSIYKALCFGNTNGNHWIPAGVSPCSMNIVLEGLFWSGNSASSVSHRCDCHSLVYLRVERFIGIKQTVDFVPF